MKWEENDYNHGRTTVFNSHSHGYYCSIVEQFGPTAYKWRVCEDIGLGACIIDGEAQTLQQAKNQVAQAIAQLYA